MYLDDASSYVLAFEQDFGGSSPTTENFFFRVSLSIVRVGYNQVNCCEDSHGGSVQKTSHFLYTYGSPMTYIILFLFVSASLFSCVFLLSLPFSLFCLILIISLSFCVNLCCFLTITFTCKCFIDSISETSVFTFVLLYVFAELVGEIAGGYKGGRKCLL